MASTVFRTPFSIGYVEQAYSQGLVLPVRCQVERYLRGYRHMTLDLRQQEAFRLRAAVEAQVSPSPPVDAHSMDVLATVLAVRRKQLGTG